MDPEKQALLPNGISPTAKPRQLSGCSRLLIGLWSFFACCSLLLLLAPDVPQLKKDCLDDELGFVCRPDISRYWGQYSPYWKLDSEIPDEVPDGCEITFAQVLSRHGARDPTLKRTLRLISTMATVKALGTFEGKYKFLKKFEYKLGADQLNEFGRRELRASGKVFKTRYSHLGKPFLRTAGQKRVVDSAKAFIEGWGSHLDLLELPEGSKYNNTLAHALCDNIENGPISNIRDAARDAWQSVFLPPIANRLSNDLGMPIKLDDAHNMMSMCPMETVHSATGRISKFCDLFTIEEFRSYSHFESLEKFYGWAKGNPLGPTQGVGFANELIARMLKKPVEDRTTVNHTLDNDPKTFPLDRKLYADFSHDDDLTSIFFALGLWKHMPYLSITKLDTPEYTQGWSSARTVPFSARAYFEKMKCKNDDEELVRAVVNDRVIPLEDCDADDLGRCKLSKWIDSLEWTRSGGDWDLCFLGQSQLEAATETTLEDMLAAQTRT